MSTTPRTPGTPTPSAHRPSTQEITAMHTPHQPAPASSKEN